MGYRLGRDSVRQGPETAKGRIVNALMANVDCTRRRMPASRRAVVRLWRGTNVRDTRQAAEGGPCRRALALKIDARSERGSAFGLGRVVT